MTDLDFNELTIDVIKQATHLKKTFGLSPESAVKMAKFAVLARKATDICEESLSKEGKELSEAGHRVILETIKNEVLSGKI